MAQLSGVMTADFSDFMFEIDKSVIKLKDLEGASATTNSAMGDFGEGLSTVDKTLGLFGIRIGPQIQALREFSGVLTTSTSELGAWGQAGAIAAGLAAGWQIGTLIDDWTGLSNAIGDTLATALGWDGVADRVGAKMDVLGRASDIAKRSITDFDQALVIIKQHNKDLAESFNTGAQRVADWNREIAAHKGDMPTITAELKNHSSTVQQLATHYNISKEAIEHYIRTLDASTKAQKAWADEARPKYEAIRKAQEDLTQASGGWHRTLEALTPTVTAATMAALNYGLSQDKVALALGITEIQVAAVDRQMKLNLATMAATEPALGTLDQWIGSAGKQFKVAAETGDQFKTMLELTGGTVDTLVPKIEKLDMTFRSVTEAAKVAGVAPGMDQKAPGASVPVDLGNISFGSLGYARVFEEYTKKNTSGGMLGGAIGGGPPKDFLTWALSMGLASRGPTVTNTFNIVDTESGIARRVGDTITSQVQRGSLVN